MGSGVDPDRSDDLDGTPLERVVALVGRVDLRAVIAVDLAQRLELGPVGALHVLEPGEDVEDLAARWMDLRVSNVPLRTVDGATSVAAGVARVVESERRSPGGRVTVVMARLDLSRSTRWLHDHTGDAIVAALAPLDGVEVACADVPLAV